MSFLLTKVPSYKLNSFKSTIEKTEEPPKNGEVRHRKHWVQDTEPNKKRGEISKMKKLKQNKNKKQPTYKTRKRSNNNFTKRGELMSSRRDNACSSCSITVNAKPYTRLKIDLYLPCSHENVFTCVFNTSGRSSDKEMYQKCFAWNV